MTPPSAPRPRCSGFLALSLDGYIAGPGDDLEWLYAFEGEEVDYGFEAFFASVDVVVLGRRTWDVVRAMDGWHYGDKPVIVLTHRPEAADHGETFFAGPAEALVARLAAQGAGRVYVDGGQIVRQFLDAGLLDDLTVTVVPRILGGGIPLFQPGTRPQSLILEGVQHWPNGMVQLRYGVDPGPRPAGAKRS